MSAVRRPIAAPRTGHGWLAAAHALAAVVYVAGTVRGVAVAGPDGLVSGWLAAAVLALVVTDAVVERWRGALLGRTLAASLAALVVVGGLAFAFLRTAPSSFWIHSAADYQDALAASHRVAVAAAIAFLVAQLVDRGVFLALRRRTGRRRLWLRSGASSLIALTVDTALLVVAGLAGRHPAGALAAAAGLRLLLAAGLVVALTPAVPALVALVERAGRRAAASGDR